MLVYLIMIFLTWIFSALAVNYSTNNGLNVTKITPSKFFVFLILLLWCSVYALRYRVGTDFGTYYYSFNRIINDNISVVDFVSEKRDYLFGLIQAVSVKVFNGNWIVFSYICAFLTYFPIVMVIHKKSTDFVSSALLFIFTMAYFSGFNGIRQSIAVGLVFIAYYCGLKEKKYWLYIILVLLAFGFHSTVFIAVPFQILSLKGIKSNIFKVTVVVLLLSYIFLWNMWSGVIDFLELIGQSKLASDYVDLQENGSSLIRLAVSIVPLVLGLVYRKTLQKLYPDIDSEIILLCIAVIFTLFSLKNWIFYRVASYFNIVLILFLPKLKFIFVDKSKNAGKIMILVLYFLYMYALLLHGESALLPYRFIITQ